MLFSRLQRARYSDHLRSRVLVNDADSRMHVLTLSMVAAPVFSSFSHCMLRFMCGCGEDEGDDLRRLTILTMWVARAQFWKDHLLR
jgi:hypothetical protein